MSDETKGKKAAEQDEPLVITNEELADLDREAPGASEHPIEPTLNEPTLIDFLASVPFELVGGATKLAAKTVEFTFNAGRSLLQPERLEMMAETGRYVREMRELAGLTVDELAEALNLEDNTVLEAVEKGTATLSFELILRLASVVARHDPLPVHHAHRTYLQPLHLAHSRWLGYRPHPSDSGKRARVRQYPSVRARHDASRKISDEGFQHVLTITKGAFDMALHYVAEQEGIEDKLIREKKDKDAQNGQAQNLAIQAGSR